MATKTDSARGGRPAMTTETILDLIEKLGLIDMISFRLRQKLEEVDIDELFDELGAYVRRNPEVLVVALATITVSAGLIVYLNARREDGWYDEEDEVEEVAAARPRPAPQPRVPTSRPTATRPRRQTT